MQGLHALNRKPFSAKVRLNERCKGVVVGIISVYQRGDDLI
jgi:hypothetical protein